MQKKEKSSAEKLLERSNTPILVLAILAIVLYILELFRVVPRSLILPFLWLNFLIDFIFLLDLIAKWRILGRSYLKSPWFFIDLISTLPIISSAFELMGAMGPQLQATRVARGARIARIARVARLAKVARVARLATAIRSKQGLNFLKLDNGNQETPTFNQSLFIGVPLLLIGFVLASSFITNSEVKKLQSTVQQAINGAQTSADLAAISKKYDVASALNPLLENTILFSEFNGGVEVPVSLQEAYIRADRLTGIMLLVVLLTIGVSVFISNALSQDRSSRREHSILSQCFSPPIVNKFYSSPEVIERFYRQWMTVFFIDIRGFTKAVEKDAGDVEGLALKLRKVMDTARRQIVVSHEGIIDKFMGDAVMGWVGGHFSVHWKLMEEVRKNLYIEELDFINQDIKSIERELEKLQGQTIMEDVQLGELTAALKEARTNQLTLLEHQKTALEKDPDLSATHQQLITEYRRRVAKSAVSCCLKIWQEVERIEDPDGFHELKIGIGSGQVLIGNFGATDQIAYTVLGPTVNRAARLEPASAQVGCHILIDANTYDLLKEEEDFRFRRIPMIAVRGISNSVATYEPFFARQVPDAFLATFEKGVIAMEAGKTEAAMAFFSKADQLRPEGDAAAKIWLEACKTAFNEGEAVGVKAMRK